MTKPLTAIPLSFTFSQFSLQDYYDCPRRFQLRYIEQLKWPAVETEPVLENERHQQEGQLFHRMVQQHQIGLSDGKLAGMNSFEQAIFSLLSRFLNRLPILTGSYPVSGLTS
jgi:hypothetical protein